MKSNLKKVLGMMLVASSVSTMVFAADHVSSNVWRDTNNGMYRANGWVCINDDNGNGVYHYTTARLESFWGTVYETSGRQYGTGTVHATTDYNGNNGYAKIYYGK
ncbi:hypothetical protein [uncultured Clostridium sp.]|uniref:hypothetical protein n=1 Tax=uncultured Clostridium sp. TaxID=59620 RepID=UPI002673C161|nr:hypothetical protein [uncultured Clostridium sp.]